GRVLERGDVAGPRGDRGERRTLAAEVAYQRHLGGRVPGRVGRRQPSRLSDGLALVLVQPVVRVVAGEQRERLREQREVGGEMGLTLVQGVRPERRLR